MPSVWRGLDLGAWRVLIRAGLRRLDCPIHGVVTEAVPFARHRSGFTRDLEDVAAFLATKTDKSTIGRFLRLDWDTIGRVCQRVAADELDCDRLDGLINVGVDEVSWKKRHHYLTLVTDHGGKKIVWGKAGKDTATLDALFTELGQARAGQIEAVSMDMGPAFAKSVRTHAPQATIAIDPFHAVPAVTDALDTVRRAVWQQMRRTDPAAAHRFKGARWALLKRPDHLTDDQAGTLRKLRHRGGELWRAYTLREAFRAIFAGDLTIQDVAELLDRWISKASRSRIEAFVKTATTSWRTSLVPGREGRTRRPPIMRGPGVNAPTRRGATRLRMKSAPWARPIGCSGLGLPARARSRLHGRTRAWGRCNPLACRTRLRRPAAGRGRRCRPLPARTVLPGRPHCAAARSRVRTARSAPRVTRRPSGRRSRGA